MKIAVTAVSGQLGAEIIKALILMIGRDNIIGIARNPSLAQHLNVDIRRGDYNRRDMLEDAFQGVYAVLLVSGNDTPDRRIPQHRNVIEAAKTAGVKKIVYTSVQGAEEGTTFSPLTQAESASHLNKAFGSKLVYRSMSIEEYRAERIAALGEFIGNIIGGIYASIRLGKADNPSQFEMAAVRPHQSWEDYFDKL